MNYLGGGGKEYPTLIVEHLVMTGGFVNGHEGLLSLVPNKPRESPCLVPAFLESTLFVPSNGPYSLVEVLRDVLAPVG